MFICYGFSAWALLYRHLNQLFFLEITHLVKDLFRVYNNTYFLYGKYRTQPKIVRRLTIILHTELI